MKSAILLIVLAILMIFVSPILLIWALNTLFALSIAYTLNTYLAGLVLILFFAAKGTK